MKDNLTKTDLIEAISQSADISKPTAEKALLALINKIVESLKKGKAINIAGLGSFSAKKREARKGRNPKTGETIDIEAANVPKFKASSKLKAELN